MSTTTTVLGIATRKGPHSLGGECHLLEVSVRVTGTYDSNSRPSFDLLSALQSQRRQGISAVGVKGALVFQDGNDGTNRYTIINANTALSGTGNKVVTFRIGGTDASNKNGTSTGEIADTTAVAHTFTLAVVTEITGAF